MLTTLVTVVGLLPLMFQFHPNFHNMVLEYQAPGSGQWVQLSAAVVWGLSFATLLTLILTPVMLAMPKVLSERFGTVFDAIRRRVGFRARKRAYEGVRIPQGGPEAPSPAPAE
jgi:multidrug efflux pump